MIKHPLRCVGHSDPAMSACFRTRKPKLRLFVLRRERSGRVSHWSLQHFVVFESWRAAPGRTFEDTVRVGFVFCRKVWMYPCGCTQPGKRWAECPINACCVRRKEIMCVLCVCGVSGGFTKKSCGCWWRREVSPVLLLFQTQRSRRYHDNVGGNRTLCLCTLLLCTVL